MNRDNVPLVAKGEPGPPRIVEIQEKYTAVEGTQFLFTPCMMVFLVNLIIFSIVTEQTACCYMFIEGNPAPSFRFTKGSINIVEGGRFRLISDGENNNMIMLAISKVKASDEAKYKLTIENCHGSDEAEFMLYVSGL